MIKDVGALRLRSTFALLFALLVAACGGASFKEGAYVDPRTGTAYEFGADGKGRLIGGVSGAPAFTYKVKGDRVVMEYSGMPGANATFRRVDGRTLERHDGARLKLQD